MTAAEASVGLMVEQRARLAGLADELIVGGAGMPSASEAEVHGVWIDRALAVRPDLVALLREVLAAPGSPREALERLRQQSRPQFDAFAFVVAGAYLINPRVRRLLGYPGPVPVRNPAFPDEAESYLEDGILDPVVRRGPIYRPTPAFPL